MHKIAMFNNKGGVGKTTLTCNLASYFAKHHGKKVLVVDCDPQCNATQLIMGLDYAEELYWDSEKENEYSTIIDILRPIEEGEATISEIVNFIPSTANRFQVDLIAGHPRLSIIEDKLSESWQQLLRGDLGGIRKSNWNTELSNKTEEYDLVIYDLGPSLGSINRSVLIGCNFFITPMGSDIFSILGIRNISNWFNSWIESYEVGMHLCERNSPNKLEQYKIPIDLSIKNGYLGYTVQQYISKVIKGERRAIKAYDEIIRIVPEETWEALGSFADRKLDSVHLQLGDVPHLYSLIPLGQTAACPILELTSEDGLIGPQYKQRDQYNVIINHIANRVLENLILIHNDDELAAGNN